jgi:hypothetical protein
MFFSKLAAEQAEQRESSTGLAERVAKLEETVASLVKPAA